MRTKPPSKSTILKVRLVVLVFNVAAVALMLVKVRQGSRGVAVYRGWIDWLPVALLILSIVGSAWALIMSTRGSEWSKECQKKWICAECGYDVRASPERCPECGTSVIPE